MRRKPGTLLTLELTVLQAALDLRSGGQPAFHGYAMAKQIAEADTARKLTAYGTLYRALARLEERGLLTSNWEDPVSAAEEGRPRRRLYAISGAGERALREERRTSPAADRAEGGRLEQGLATT